MASIDSVPMRMDYKRVRSLDRRNRPLFSTVTDNNRHFTTLSKMFVILWDAFYDEKTPGNTERKGLRRRETWNGLSADSSTINCNSWCTKDLSLIVFSSFKSLVPAIHSITDLLIRFTTILWDRVLCRMLEFWASCLHRTLACLCCQLEHKES